MRKRRDLATRPSQGVSPVASLPPSGSFSCCSVAAGVGRLLKGIRSVRFVVTAVTTRVESRGDVFTPCETERYSLLYREMSASLLSVSLRHGFHGTEMTRDGSSALGYGGESSKQKQGVYFTSCGV